MQIGRSKKLALGLTSGARDDTVADLNVMQKRRDAMQETLAVGRCQRLGTGFGASST